MCDTLLLLVEMNDDGIMTLYPLFLLVLQWLDLQLWRQGGALLHLRRVHVQLLSQARAQTEEEKNRLQDSKCNSLIESKSRKSNIQIH